jgi:Flp pilus assembly pilin Flp
MRGANKKNKHFITSRQGTAAIEYGLLSELIVVTILTAMTLAGPKFNGVFNAVATNLQVAVSG